MGKKKQFVGKIPFNIFGDLVSYYNEHYSHGYHYIKRSDIVSGQLYANRMNGEKLVAYDASELNLEMFPQEQRVNSWSSEMYIGKCDSVILKDNFEFKDRLEYKGYSKGRSAIHLNFVSLTTDRSYHMFMSDFSECLIHVEKLILEGEFTFCKKGANYGLKFLRK